MTYEYKSIVISKSNKGLAGDSSDILNEWFNYGWEYVDSITQSVSHGYNSNHGSVIVVLKKLKGEGDLLP